MAKRAYHLTHNEPSSMNPDSVLNKQRTKHMSFAKNSSSSFNEVIYHG